MSNMSLLMQFILLNTSMIFMIMSCTWAYVLQWLLEVFVRGTGGTHRDAEMRDPEQLRGDELTPQWDCITKRGQETEQKE